MAITTLAGVKSGLQQPFHYFKSAFTDEAVGFYGTSFYIAGAPEAAVAPSPGIDGAALTAYGGSIPWVNPASGNGYVAAVHGGVQTATITSSQGHAVLCDRLWHNSGISITTTTEQAIASPAWPARDRNGAVNGEGVFIGIEVSTALGNVGAITNTTLNYTNSAGANGRTGTITSVPATLAANSFIWFHLQAGDTGVESVEGLTLGTTYTSGVMHLVAARPICDWNSVAMNDHTAFDAINLGFPRIYDNSVLFALYSVGGNTINAQANTLEFAHG